MQYVGLTVSGGVGVRRACELVEEAIEEAGRPASRSLSPEIALRDRCHL